MTRSRVLVALAAAAVLGIACGTETGGAATPPSTRQLGTSPLEATFAAAALEYQVPVELLKAIAHVETRVSHPGPKASMTGGYGIMNLVGREDWPALRDGARLTGQDEGRLKLDERANIRAAAAFLRQLGDHSFDDYPHLNPHDVADWWHAVSLYPGFDSHTDAQAWATQVYRTLDDGFELARKDGTVIQPAVHYDWPRHAPVAQRKDAAKEYPGAYQWQASPNYSTGRTSYEFVVVHTVQGSYAGCISWFKNSASNVSAHYVVRSSDGQVTQMVTHANSAWHASCYNGRSIGIEHEGYAQDPGTWYTTAMYTESAKLTRWIADRHGIPKTRSRIIGHVEIPSTCNKNAHWDPGTGWNWTKYMNLITGSTPGTGTGVLKGVIYSGGNTNNRVAGAVVTVSGKSVTTGTDGAFSFTLAPGTYTASVTKSGYTSASVARTITAGATVWGSMEINAVSQNGKLTGAIYTGGDVANRVAGAVVKVGTQTVTTGTDGLYEFTLAPGTYTATVTKTGFSTNTISRTVVASGTVWGSMEINPVASPGIVKGAIYTGGDTTNRVGGVTVKVSGTSHTVTTASDGLYQFSLNPGTYTITAEKTGYQNASVTRTVSSGTTIWGSMELTPGTVVVTDTTPPNVAITFPGDGSSMDLAILTITGTASDDKGPIAEVSLSVNGGTPAKVSVSSGAFEQQIMLSPGDNTIEVSATDASGNSAADSVHARFRAGIAGFVHLNDDESARLPDVELRLLDVDSGAELHKTASAQDGSFGFDLAEVGKDYLLTMKAAGFVSRTETITVPDDERLMLKLPMTQGDDPVPTEVTVEFIEPLDGAEITTESVTVYGTVGGFQVVGVTVNGVQAELVGAGGFAATVPLQVGENTIEAIATGSAGESVAGSIVVTRKAQVATGNPPPPPAQEQVEGSGGQVKSGCAALPGFELWALLALLPAVRRRRA